MPQPTCEGRGPLRACVRGGRTRDDGADNLLWAIDGTPGSTWQSGEYYEPRKLERRPNPQQADAALADAFWVESARRVGLGL